MSKIPNSNIDNEEIPPSTPRWVKVSGIIVIVLILLVVIMIFFGGGEHGPGRHALGEEPTEQEVPNDQTPDENQDQKTNRDDNGGHKPPRGGH